jgi:hypothetical protein
MVTTLSASGCSIVRVSRTPVSVLALMAHAAGMRIRSPRVWAAGLYPGVSSATGGARPAEVRGGGVTASSGRASRVADLNPYGAPELPVPELARKDV